MTLAATVTLSGDQDHQNGFKLWIEDNIKSKPIALHKNMDICTMNLNGHNAGTPNKPRHLIQLCRFGAVAQKQAIWMFAGIVENPDILPEIQNVPQRVKPSPNMYSEWQTKMVTQRMYNFSACLWMPMKLLQSLEQSLNKNQKLMKIMISGLTERHPDDDENQSDPWGGPQHDSNIVDDKYTAPDHLGSMRSKSLMIPMSVYL
ncbi:hypothetical protein BT96DRAFT_949210 [Gymnopus androsaceus JB14]|uniref:Uncharacterized protein n=1 Tax=Gymnopus androsaceus JB14 TaxID=1447944 RepID=A0A6A4GL74_9AGAR|nr:hypothetical protein BT96DRAFT_949210 [Gymnopus androsaceus JB14]